MQSRNPRPLTAFAVCVALISTLLTVQPASSAVAGFGDVADDQFFSEPIQWMVNRGITTGTSEGCFSPDRSVTRGEFATFIWRYAGEPSGGPQPFRDVHSGDFFAVPVAWMADRQITTGTSPTTFEPNRAVTRGEAATMLWRYAGRPAGDGHVFTDVDAGDFFNDAVAWMLAAGITIGTTPSTFSPQRAISRAEIATFLWRFDDPAPTVIDRNGQCGPAAPTNGFETLAPGADLPSGEQCAGWLTDGIEIRPDNTAANNTTGSGPHPTYPRVDGDFTGTTEEIIQWAACKWGIDEDIARAQVVRESWWHQDAQGDLTNDSSSCHPAFRHLSPCPESIGLMQVRYLYHGAAMDDSIASSAYNLDYAYAVWRACYEGELTWLGGSYGAGDVWGCLGVWFAGRWYANGASTYIAEVQTIMSDRTWETPVFVNDQ